MNLMICALFVGSFHFPFQINTLLTIVQVIIE